MNTIIITDSCNDLPLSYVEENNIPVVSMTFHFKGREYEDDFGKTIGYKDFYNAVRDGEIPSTSQINAFKFAEIFRRYVSEGKSVIYIGFSSALSGSFNSAVMAREMVLKEQENADITVIDSKSASTGLGMLVYYAYEMQKKGRSKDEIVKWIEENKLKMNHWFTVDDLHHLKRGGRVSGTAAILGTILDIKPVLHVDDEGRLIPVTKVKGRRKSIKMLFEKFGEIAVNPGEQTIFISHGDAEEDANSLKKLIMDNYPVKEVITTYIGPVVGSHSGPGTIALFFLGSNR